MGVMNSLNNFERKIPFTHSVLSRTMLNYYYVTARSDWLYDDWDLCFDFWPLTFDFWWLLTIDFWWFLTFGDFWILVTFEFWWFLTFDFFVTCQPKDLIIFEIWLWIPSSSKAPLFNVSYKPKFLLRMISTNQFNDAGGVLEIRLLQKILKGQSLKDITLKIQIII